MSDKKEVIDVEMSNEPNLPSTVPTTKSLLNQEQALQIAKARAELFVKMKGLAINNTGPKDWIDYGGKPGLDGPGSERVARTIGLVSFDCKDSKEDIPTGGYMIYVKGKIGFQGGEFIEVIGSCSSLKPFFTAKLKEGQIVNEGDIRKNALTNFYMNGVTRFMGLRGLTWEELKEISNGKICQDKAQKIEYGSAKEQERGDKEKDKSVKTWEWLLEMNGGSVQDSKIQLQTLTSFQPTNGKKFNGYTNIDKATDKVINILYPKVEKLYKQWVKSAEGAGETPKNSKNETGSKEREPGMEG